MLHKNVRAVYHWCQCTPLPNVAENSFKIELDTEGFIGGPMEIIIIAE